jgi:hypothetical protein
VDWRQVATFGDTPRGITTSVPQFAGNPGHVEGHVVVGRGGPKVNSPPMLLQWRVGAGCLPPGGPRPAAIWPWAGIIATIARRKETLIGLMA